MSKVALHVNPCEPAKCIGIIIAPIGEVDKVAMLVVAAQQLHQSALIKADS